MSATNDFKEDHMDEFYEWVADKKYEEACDWCNGLPMHQDDDFEEIIETYAEENSDDLWKEFTNTLPQ